VRRVSSFLGIAAATVVAAAAMLVFTGVCVWTEKDVELAWQCECNDADKGLGPMHSCAQACSVLLCGGVEPMGVRVAVHYDSQSRLMWHG